MMKFKFFSSNRISFNPIRTGVYKLIFDEPSNYHAMNVRSVLESNFINGNWEPIRILFSRNISQIQKDYLLNDPVVGCPIGLRTYDISGVLLETYTFYMCRIVVCEQIVNMGIEITLQPSIIINNND